MNTLLLFSCHLLCSQYATDTLIAELINREACSFCLQSIHLTLKHINVSFYHLRTYYDCIMLPASKTHHSQSIAGIIIVHVPSSLAKCGLATCQRVGGRGGGGVVGQAN